VILRGSVEYEIEEHMASDTSRELGGVLVGSADAISGVVVITAFERLPDDGAAKTVNFSRQTWDTMTARVLDHHPGSTIVGWYHSHPDSGIFFSAHDLLTHTTYFGQPWQIAYVYDPLQDERGMFGWDRHDLVRIARWELTGPKSGIATALPANTPAHPGARGAEAEAAARERGLEPTSTAASARLAPAVSEPDDFDEWMASAAALGLAPPATRSLVPAVVTRPPQPSVEAPRPVYWRRALVALLGVLVIVAGVLAFVVKPGDDSDAAPTTTSATVPATIPVVTLAPTTIGGTATTSSSSTTSTTTTSTTEAPTTTTEAPTTTAAPTTTQIPTPKAVTAPAARLAGGSVACTSGTGNSYRPTAPCFVALPNGNIVSWADSKLSCADPSHAAIGTSASFKIGVENDRLAMIGDGGALLPKCADLSYARNVFTGGVAPFPGLCGSEDATIDDTTTRCFGQNLATGAMFAVVKGFATGPRLVGLCFSAVGGPTAIDLTWSVPTVDTSWSVAAVSYDPASGQFIIGAGRDGGIAGATAACA
jgi:proteasome lid subunit RPN8/RPN11